MAPVRLRVALDANVLIAGTMLPRWPHEVMRAALLGTFDTALPEQVVQEARGHLPGRRGLEDLDAFLIDCAVELLPMPSPDLVMTNLDLVRSEKDVPIALALLAANVDILVTNDRDFTDEGATAERFREKVRVMLPAVFLRDVVGWTSSELESIRNRGWSDLQNP
jgi:predicted nucleic acid-binding protein